MLNLITPDWPAAPHVNAVSTLRVGGTSAAPYRSLNLGNHVGDDERCVAQNRAILQTQTGLFTPPVWLNQTHSTDVIELLSCDDNTHRHAPPPAHILSAADASITADIGTVCAVLTADCLPILLTDLQGEQVAAVHAGWRGMAGGIIERAVARFNAPAGELLAWLGPCIGPAAFEVGSEVKRALGGPEAAYRRNQSRDHKMYANLPMLAEHRLWACGVRQCDASGECTYSDSERFFSYRRDGQTGRMATLIWLNA